MRIFYTDEGPIDTLLQIAEKPIADGDLVSKFNRDAFVQRGWVIRMNGHNIITDHGLSVISTLKLARVNQ